jgi:hypothetical protein
MDMFFEIFLCFSIKCYLYVLQAQYKDFIDEFSYKLIKTNLETMDFDSDEIKLKAEVKRLHMECSQF